MRRQLLATVAIVSWCTFLTAVGELLEDHRRKCAAADDLEAADCSDVVAAHENCPPECCETVLRASAVC
jgi:hypothetical protein